MQSQLPGMVAWLLRVSKEIRHRAAGTSGVIANALCWSAIPSLLLLVCHPQSAGLLFLRGQQGSLSAFTEMTRVTVSQLFFDVIFETPLLSLLVPLGSYSSRFGCQNDLKK